MMLRSQTDHLLPRLNKNLTKKEFLVSKRLYVGNIPFKMSEKELVDAFSECGKVSGVFIVKDKETQRSKGYAFIEMENEALAKKAITEMEGKLVGGRVIKVSEAIEPRQTTPPHIAK